MKKIVKILFVFISLLLVVAIPGEAKNSGGMIPAQPNISDMKDIYDIKGIEKEQKTISDYLIYILIAVVVCAEAYYIYKYIKANGLPDIFRRKKKLQEGDPERMYMADLESLRKRKLWLAGDVKLHFSLLSDSLRRFLEARYSFDAVEMTTAEIEDELEKKKNPHSENILSVLKQSDLVKFAKIIPTAEECSNSIAEAEKLIR